MASTTDREAPRETVRRVSLLATLDDSGVLEEDSQLQICRALSQWENIPSETTVSPSVPDQNQGQEIFGYHDGVSSLTILGEVLAGSRANKLVKIVLRRKVNDAPDPVPSDSANEHIDYLRQRGAFVLPPGQTWYATPFLVAIICVYLY